MKHVIMISLLVALTPVASLAQSTLEGTWLAELTPPGASTFDFEFEIRQVADSLQMTTGAGEEQRAMQEVSYDAVRLRFVMPTDHGRVTCTLVRKEEDLMAGVCVGPMGESVTTMKRKQEGESVRR